MVVDCAPLLMFQTNTTRRWHSRAECSNDLFAASYFCFSGFDALYFARAKADDLRKSEGREAGEVLQIKNLLQELDSEEAKEIHARLSPAIEFGIAPFHVLFALCHDTSSQSNLFVI